jgi:hypothetical protein
LHSSSHALSLLFLLAERGYLSGLKKLRQPCCLVFVVGLLAFLYSLLSRNLLKVLPKICVKGLLRLILGSVKSFGQNLYFLNSNLSLSEVKILILKVLVKDLSH